MRLIAYIRKDRFYLLLTTQLIFIFVLPFVEIGSKTAPFVQSSGLSLILLSGSNIFKRKSWKKIGGFTLAILFIILVTISSMEQFPTFYTVTFILFFFLSMVIIWEIISMLLFTKEIKMSLLAGALAGYLMMAICLMFFVITVGVLSENEVLTNDDGRSWPAGCAVFLFDNDDHNWLRRYLTSRPAGSNGLGRCWCCLSILHGCNCCGHCWQVDV